VLNAEIGSSKRAGQQMEHFEIRIGTLKEKNQDKTHI
jgi:hypothetical protein